jgi:chitodextrinase
MKPTNHSIASSSDKTSQGSSLINILSMVLFILILTSLFAHGQGRWNAKVTDWTQPLTIGDWGFNRPGYPAGLYIHGVTMPNGYFPTNPLPNPVIYDNDEYADVLDDDVLNVMASLGKITLAAQIITPIDPTGVYKDAWKNSAFWGYDRCNASNMCMNKIPYPKVGNTGGAANTNTDGARAYVDIILAQYAANPDKPVIIAMGGQSATLASAYQLNSSIADKVIVFYVSANAYNGQLSWASEIVCRNMRVVHAYHYWWPEICGSNQLLALPKNNTNNWNDISGEWAVLNNIKNQLGRPSLPFIDDPYVDKFRCGGFLERLKRNNQYNAGHHSSCGDDAYSDGNVFVAWEPSMYNNALLRSVRGGMVIDHEYNLNWVNRTAVHNATYPYITNPAAFTGCGTDTQAPTAPTNLSSSSITQTSFTLSWTASTDNVGVTGYEVFANGASKGTTASNSLIVTGLTCNTAYSMTVKARDAAGNWSAASSALNVSTSACSTGETVYAKINFQPASASVPTGYIKDDGSTYGARNGFTYGWSANNTANTRLRTNGADQRYKTFNHMMKDGTFTWEIAVPNGNYRVDVLCGDGDFTDQVNSLSIEGVAANDPDGQDNFDLFTNIQVSVSDGKLTVIPTGTNTKICYIDIYSVSGGTDTQAPTAPTNLSSSSITQTSFTLSWTASTDNVGVTGYEVFAGGVSKGTTTSTSLSVTGLSCNTAYSMTVKARDAANNWSAASSALNVSTSACSTGETVYAKINFQPATASVPVGYIKDDGSIYGARNGFTYGWSANNTANTRLRTNGADQRYKTLNHMMLNGTFTWEIAVPNGSYRVDVLCGDGDYTNQVNNLSIEGVAVTDPDGQDNFDLFTNIQVSVSDGKLTVIPTGTNTKICYIDIYSVSSGPDTQAPTVPTNLSASSIGQTSFSLSWTASTDNVGVTGYEVFANGASKGTTTSTSLSITGLSCNTAYSMTVKARDAANNWSAASSALVVTTSGCSTIDPAMKIWWKFDETSGTTASDATGNGRNGSLLNGLQFSGLPGIFGSALAFDAVDDVVRYNSNPGVTAYPFSISAWIKTSSTGNQCAVFFGDGTAGDKYFSIGTNSGKAFATARNTTAYAATGSATISNGAWHHLVGVFESATSRKLYVDGALAATSTNSVAIVANINRFSAGLLDRSTIADKFNGTIDDVRLYGKTLSAAEINDIYNGLKSASMSTSFENLDVSSDLLVFPNPLITGNLNVKLGFEARNATLLIHSITGKLVHSSILNGNAQEILGSTFENGVYILTLTTENDNFKKMFVKE